MKGYQLFHKCAMQCPRGHVRHGDIMALTAYGARVDSSVLKNILVLYFITIKCISKTCFGFLATPVLHAYLHLNSLK